MKVVNDLYYNIKDVRFYKQQFIEAPNKKNILFVDPVMSNFDFYTMIIPFLSLGDTESEFQTAITGMYRYSEINDIPDKVLSEQEVKWADVIVLPMTLEQFNGKGMLYEELREINPDIKIIQTVELDFYEIKMDHYLLEFNDSIKRSPKQISEMKEKMIERYDDNCRGADRLLVLNPNLGQKLLDKGFKDVEWCPTYIDEKTFKENIDFTDSLGIKNAAGFVIVSCTLIESTASAFKEYIPIFQELKKKYKDKFRLVVLGKNPKKLFPELGFDVDRLQRGSIVNQMKAIVRSSADFHLALNKKNEYSNNTEATYTFVERGLFGVPIASMSVTPYKELIENNTNGFILKSRKDLIKIVATMMKDKTNLIQMSTNLKKEIIATYQIDEEKRENLAKIFFQYERTTEVVDLNDEPDED